jgi:hypothetical protein
VNVEESGEVTEHQPRAALASESVAFLIGTGAQVNSWEPVLRALRRVAWSHVESAEEANGILAHVVQVRRWFAHAVALLREQGKADHQPSATGLQEANATYARICEAIRHELALSENPADADGIRLQPQFNDVWKVLIGDAQRVCILTPNWDRVLSREASRRWPGAGDEIVYHLHGDRRDGAGFLLPSETTFEPYRDAADVRLLNRRRSAMMAVLEEAERLVIYGLSLAPSDAELAHVLTHGLAIGRVTHIDIVDPNHRSVARRLQALIPSRRIEVFGRDPSAPGISHDWTL